MAVSLFGVAFAALVLYLFPPESVHFYPLCPFHLYTGLLCPGCGATRALAALTHGRFGEAIHQNALTVLLLPAVALYFGRAYLRMRRGDELPPIPRTITVLVAVGAATFTLVRNLPHIAP